MGVLVVVMLDVMAIVTVTTVMVLIDTRLIVFFVLFSP
jgi:hypothetical protein